MLVGIIRDGCEAERLRNLGLFEGACVRVIESQDGLLLDVRGSRVALGAALASVITAAGLRVERLTWFSRFSVLGWWFNGRVRGVSRIPLDQLRTFDRLVPLLRLERFLPLPFGQSLIAVGRAP